MIKIGPYFILILTGLASLGIGVFLGVTFQKKIAERDLESAQSRAKRLVSEAMQEAKTIKREMIAEAKEEIQRLRSEMERELRERRNELQRLERRLEQKEENLERKMELVSKREEELRAKQLEVDQKIAELEEIKQKELMKLEELSGLSVEEAKELLLERIEKDVEYKAGLVIKEIEERTKREADRRAKEIITTAIQRCAVEHTSDITVSVVSLPSDDMKGRIIGREGRNIKAFEQATGVDLIVDDTPEAVTLSSFDPVRREIARIALDRLVLDGRIHPARIEEMVERARREVEEKIVEAGEEALDTVNVKDVHPELVNLLGRLHFRTSYGQNALKHSIEVAHLCGIMAAELGLDEQVARRAGLLHDIGKAVDFTVEGPHALIGADLAKKYGEIPIVVNAIAAHHEEVDFESEYAVLVLAADAISASRPGARRETLEAYIKRLEKLESIAMSFEGVQKAYAIQAGREIRVMVNPGVVDDAIASKLAYDIAKKIEEEIRYPGQIKITVIRETRATEYAR